MVCFSLGLFGASLRSQKRNFYRSICKILVDQDVGVDPFFDELFSHWNVRLRPGISVIPIEVPDSDDESSDFTDFMIVKEDPYCGSAKTEPEVAKPAVVSQPSAASQNVATMAPPVECQVPKSTPVVVTVEDESPARLPTVPKTEPMNYNQVLDDTASRIERLKFLGAGILPVKFC